MQIECRLKREGGTAVTLGENDYEFKPLAKAKGSHVCTVEDELHVEAFLNIPEAYNEYGQKPRSAADVVEKVEEEVLEDEPELVTADMNNGDLIRWATERGMNAKSKKSIIDYAGDNYDVELDAPEDVQCIDLIRAVIQLEIEEKAAE